MRNNESSENYLETILILSKKLPVVRSVDIANELGFKKSSVSIAMKNLREKNNITVSDAGFITLTESGRQIAEMIYERHELLSECLEKLGVDKEIAAEDACRIEHVMRKIIYNSGAVIGDIKSERGKDETDIKIFEGVQKGMHLCSVI